jgi:CNT family concentrative nucleoside transporter
MALRITSFFGLLVIFGIAWLMSEKRREIVWRPVVGGIALQLVLAVLILKTPPGTYIFEAVKNVFITIIEASKEGEQFLWKGVMTNIPFVFIISVPCTIIFFSSLMALLYHWGIMQKCIKGMAWVMRRTMRISGRESLAAAANVFVGMTEAPLVIRPYLQSLNRSEMMALMTTGLATIAGTVMAAYVGMGIDAGHLLTASVMSAPAALAIAKIIVPGSSNEISEDIAIPDYMGEKRAVNSFDAIAAGSRDGLFLALNVLAMLIAVVSLLALINILLRIAGGWVNIDNLSLQKIFSYAGWPFALAMGVDPADARTVGELLSTKIFMTEFVAYTSLSQQLSSLSPRSVTITTYALCGFANFASVAIIIGGLTTLAPERKTDVVQLALKALIGGALASFSTAAIVGIFI